MSDRVKDEIHQKALDLFSQKGYLRTSMLDIAREVGLTKGGIYHHVKKKEDLLILIHNEITEAFLKRYKKVEESEAEPVDKLMNWITTHVSLMTEYQSQIKVFFNELDNLETEDSYSDVVLKRDRIFEMLLNIIKQGIEEKQFRQDLDPNVVSLLIFGTLNWFYQWYRPDGPLSAEELAEEVKRFIGLGVIQTSHLWEKQR